MKTKTHTCCSCVEHKPTEKNLSIIHSINGKIEYKNNIPKKEFEKIYNKVKNLIKGKTYTSFIERYGIKLKYKLIWEEDTYVTIKDVSIDTRYHTIGNDALMNFLKDFQLEDTIIDCLRDNVLHQLPEYVEFKDQIDECCTVLNRLMDDYPGFDDQLFIFDKVYRELRGQV